MSTCSANIFDFLLLRECSGDYSKTIQTPMFANNNVHVTVNNDQIIIVKLIITLGTTRNVNRNNLISKL